MPDDNSKKNSDTGGDWTKDFQGYVKYSKNGIAVVEPKDPNIPFDIVYKGDKRKVLPRGEDIEKYDFDSLDDLNKNDLFSNIKVNDKVMTAFNDYVDWMKDKGYSGKEDMNHTAYSNKVFQEYKKDHPESILTPDYIVPIQREIHKYRDNLISGIKAGTVKLDFKPKDDYSDVMSWAGTELGKKNDGIVGQYTSSFKFPSEYMNAKTEANRIGFAKDSDLQKGSGKNQNDKTVTEPGEGIFYSGKRVAELFKQGDKNVLKFRNDNNYTGQVTELSDADLQKYVGTTNSIQSELLYNQLINSSKK